MTEFANGPPPPSSPDYQTAMVHLYRGEMHRMTVWRQRLDITSNWAIILTTGLTTFTLGSNDVPHYTLLLGLALIGISILIEGRRYRHLHHSKWRMYLLEFGYFAELLDPEGTRDPLPDWRWLLAADLRHAHYAISWLTAIRVRLRRNYLLLVYFVTAIWFTKLYIHPGRPHHLSEFYQRLTVGDFIEPWFVALSAVVFIATATALAVTCPPAERLEDWSAHYTRQRTRRMPPSDIPPEPGTS